MRLSFRLSVVTALVFFCVLCGVSYAQPNKVNPYTGIAWPANCSASGTVAYNFLNNTCFAAGSSIAPIVYRGAWSSVTTYALNNAVLFSGNQYVSLQNANLNQNPGTATSFWALLLSSDVTAATMQAALAAQTGCTTTGFAWNPATNTCVASAVTAAAMQSALSGQTGCTTTGFAWNPATNTCIAASGYTSITQQAITGFIGINQTNPTAMLDVNGEVHVGSPDTNIAPSQDPQVNISRTLTDGNIHHGFNDDVKISNSQPYGDYDARPEITSAAGNIDHLVTFQAIPTIDAGYTGTLSRLLGGVAYANINCTACTVSSIAALEIDDVITTNTPTLPLNYGIHVLRLSAAGTNYGLHVDDNDVYIGGTIILDRATTASTRGMDIELAGIPVWFFGQNAGATTDYVMGGSATAMGCVLSTNRCYFPTGVQFGSSNQTAVDGSGNVIVGTAQTLKFGSTVGLSFGGSGVIFVDNGTAGSHAGQMELASETVDTNMCVGGGCAVFIQTTGITTPALSVNALAGSKLPVCETGGLVYAGTNSGSVLACP